ncbi:helix-turn-helix domain-containing protein [Peptostreptococcus canis]|uniref:Helix-turn-helix domain-containing protein n=1 Tax=Peptostreptococcus canis TaxID=1159213 RepID=A0ABR6TIM0_9FIRM|nr:helix-turn-helix domain-containing protein [Peptostreptococcus canis]MBC2575265.1 hypothetical protein [Peptostreptococcus canis]MBP1997552.1 DNA invertase Pin-like site-specific DNA recombinase [Peptostreptococcus canis]
MRKVKLTINEQNKYEAIKKIVEKGGNKNRVAKALGVSRRTIDRIIIRYKKCPSFDIGYAMVCPPIHQGNIICKK